MFYRRTAEEHTIIAVATDDMAITSKQPADAKRFKNDIKMFWDITDHGPIKWFLGFEIKRDWKARTLSINQHAYIESMVEKFRLTNMKKVLTPIDPHVQYSTKQCPSTLAQVEHMKWIPYSEAIGSIIWPAIVSCPDIAYAVGILLQFMQNPRQVLQRIFLNYFDQESLKKICIAANIAQVGTLIHFMIHPSLASVK